MTLSDLELLHVEVDTLWERDAGGRLIHARRPDRTPAPHVVLAVCNNGAALFIGAHVPEHVAAALHETHAGNSERQRPSNQPASFASFAATLEHHLGATVVTSGPTYVVPEHGVTYAPNAATIRRSTDDDADALAQSAPPEANWGEGEWRDLIDGKLGPWAMAMVDEAIVSICHSARLSARGAEAGTWTEPRFRGQGYASAATAAWVKLLAGTGRHVFYSTSADNRSSQRVAERLRLRQIGWLWRIGPA